MSTGKKNSGSFSSCLTYEILYYGSNHGTLNNDWRINFNYQLLWCRNHSVRLYNILKVIPRNVGRLPNGLIRKKIQYHTIFSVQYVQGTLCESLFFPNIIAPLAYLAVRALATGESLLLSNPKIVMDMCCMSDFTLNRRPSPSSPRWQKMP